MFHTAKMRCPSNGLCLLTILVGVVWAIFARSPISATRTHGIGPQGFTIAIFFAAMLVQWLILRNEFLDLAVWLPVVFSAAGILIGELAWYADSPNRRWFEICWVLWLSIPVYSGSAIMIITARLKNWRKQS